MKGPERLYVSEKMDDAGGTEYIRGDIVETIRQERRDAVAKVEQLQGIMREACEKVAACGHTDTCRCCWCDMRRLFAEPAGYEPDVPTHDGQKVYAHRDAGKVR